MKAYDTIKISAWTLWKKCQIGTLLGSTFCSDKCMWLDWKVKAMTKYTVQKITVTSVNFPQYFFLFSHSSRGISGELVRGSWMIYMKV
jgi:hypothetical protein